MDATQEVGEAEGIIEEQADIGGAEDQDFDSLEAAEDALEDDAASEEEPVADEADAESGEENVEVTLASGEKVTLKELKEGYFRAKDYTHKTTEVAQEKKQVEATRAQLVERTTVMETALQNLSGYLQSLIPPEPNISLARSNPGEYQYQLAVRQNAIAELGHLVSMKGAIEETKTAVSEADLREYREREQAALIGVMPALADPVKRAVFDGRVRTLAKDFGFSDEEIGETHDHRILRLVHYAGIGMKAEENRRNAGRRVETPKLAKAKSTPPPVNVESRKAMHALTKSGSIKDIRGIDF